MTRLMDVSTEEPEAGPAPEEEDPKP